MERIVITRAGMGEKCPNHIFKKLLEVGMITACLSCPYFVIYDEGTILCDYKKV
nr:MAG TPA: hypothetical protein [Caudoviricetes sp.]